MTNPNPVPASDIAEINNSVPATDSAAPIVIQSSGDDHRIPKVRLDEEIAKRRALEGELDEIANGILAEVPENLKPLIPEGFSPAAKVNWFNNAKATGVFNSKPDVPTTDTGKPSTTPKDTNFKNMPIAARMSAGYGK